MTLVARAAVLVSFPVSAAIVGSLFALIRRPGPRLISGIQHFAAGVVMAALVGEVMPDLRREGQLPWAVGGFVIGVAVVLSLGAWGRRLESGERSVARTVGYVLPVGLLVAVGIDLVLDGSVGRPGGHPRFQRGADLDDRVDDRDLVLVTVGGG
ncbi:hypothetical protein MLP_52310 [Microlunatus phosphovorus NM-1]|uniref:Transporter n=1 Tax=Microlunatus phosphovorus (strain ATCC 700054 / DSM 10555 / JCM 9379 / NBRC 101784 / NCIMB 13414 / VKM Ac-1990 / NM-1) TaxID=1032480 RepID=F5XIK7_MICPN|nr:hypothetical protein MLP_52310 [Microlunatus phosphovorus NM-1]